LKFLARDAHQAVRAYRRALRMSPPAFAQRHLVEVVGEPVPLDHWWMVFQRIAGDDLALLRVLADASDDPDFQAFCATVVRSLVADWNPSLAHSPRSLPAADFLRAHLKHRLDDGSPLRSWAERMRLPIAGGPQYLAVDGWDLQLPNPF